MPKKKIDTAEVITAKGLPARIRVTAHSQGEWSSNNNIAGAGPRAASGQSKDKWIKIGRAGGVTAEIERDLEEGEDPYDAINAELDRLQAIVKERTRLPSASDLVSGKTEKKPNE